MKIKFDVYSVQWCVDSKNHINIQFGCNESEMWGQNKVKFSKKGNFSEI